MVMFGLTFFNNPIYFLKPDEFAHFADNIRRLMENMVQDLHRFGSCGILKFHLQLLRFLFRLGVSGELAEGTS